MIVPLALWLGRSAGLMNAAAAFFRFCTMVKMRLVGGHR